MKITKVIFTLLLAQCLTAVAFAQQEMALYDSAIPNAIKTANEEKGDSSAWTNVSQPKLAVFLPTADKRNGISVIVVPGGGYGAVVIKKEGYAIAQALSKQGFTAFVLKYRLPSDKWMKDKSIGPLQDAQQAIKTVRVRAGEWNIDPNKVGIMGFSAGGHLASTAGTHFNKSYIENKEAINLRPDFLVLGYAVISLTDSLMHKGSRDNLLGPNPSPAMVQLFSNEQQVTPQTPPTFLIHTQDDNVVDVRNSLVFYNALVNNKIPSELHVYPHGPHGFGINPPFEFWLDMCGKWKSQLFVK